MNIEVSEVEAEGVAKKLSKKKITPSGLLKRMA
jgi:hypothetical protein